MHVTVDVAFGRQPNARVLLFSNQGNKPGAITTALQARARSEDEMPDINIFEAAKAISEVLKDLDKDRQHQVLRWVAESLDIALHVKPAVPHPASAGSDEASTTPRDGVRSPDIKAFIEMKDPKSDVQFAAAVAYYYRFEAPADQRQDTISSETLQEATRLAGRQRLKGPGDTLHNGKKQGYLDLAGRGAYRINTVGENLVAMTMPASAGGASRKGRAAGKRASSRNQRGGRRARRQ